MSIVYFHSVTKRYIVFWNVPFVWISLSNKNYKHSSKYNAHNIIKKMKWFKIYSILCEQCSKTILHWFEWCISFTYWDIHQFINVSHPLTSVASFAPCCDILCPLICYINVLRFQYVLGLVCTWSHRVDCLTLELCYNYI